MKFTERVARKGLVEPARVKVVGEPPAFAVSAVALGALAAAATVLGMNAIGA